MAAIIIRNKRICESTETGFILKLGAWVAEREDFPNLSIEELLGMA